MTNEAVKKVMGRKAMVQPLSCGRPAFNVYTGVVNPEKLTISTKTLNTLRSLSRKD